MFVRWVYSLYHAQYAQYEIIDMQPPCGVTMWGWYTLSLVHSLGRVNLQGALPKDWSQNLLGDNHGPPLGFTLQGHESVSAGSKKH